MQIKPIKTEKDYQAALKAVEPFFDKEPEKDTTEGDYFEVMLDLIEHYEEKHYPVEFPDPVEAIKFAMENLNISIDDLTKSIGQRNRVYEILNRKRNLTLPMIRKLNRNLNIPLESLIKETADNRYR